MVDPNIHLNAYQLLVLWLVAVSSPCRKAISLPCITQSRVRNDLRSSWTVSARRKNCSTEQFHVLFDCHRHLKALFDAGADWVCLNLHPLPEASNAGTGSSLYHVANPMLL